MGADAVLTRALVGVVALVAVGCGSSSPSSSDMQMAASDMALPMCVQTLDAFCTARGDCKRDLATAMQASSWCGDMGTGASMVTLEHCAGGQTVIVESFVDSANDWVYVNGALVAVFVSDPHAMSTLSCQAGPATFAAPTGCDAGTMLCS